MAKFTATEVKNSVKVTLENFKFSFDEKTKFDAEFYDMAKEAAKPAPKVDVQSVQVAAQVPQPQPQTQPAQGLWSWIKSKNPFRKPDVGNGEKRGVRDLFGGVGRGIGAIYDVLNGIVEGVTGMSIPKFILTASLVYFASAIVGTFVVNSAYAMLRSSIGWLGFDRMMYSLPLDILGFGGEFSKFLSFSMALGVGFVCLPPIIAIVDTATYVANSLWDSTKNLCVRIKKFFVRDGSSNTPSQEHSAVSPQWAERIKAEQQTVAQRSV